MLHINTVELDYVLSCNVHMDVTSFVYKFHQTFVGLTTFLFLCVNQGKMQCKEQGSAYQRQISV